MGIFSSKKSKEPPSILSGILSGAYRSPSDIPENARPGTLGYLAGITPNDRHRRGPTMGQLRDHRRTPVFEEIRWRQWTEREPDSDSDDTVVAMRIPSPCHDDSRPRGSLRERSGKGDWHPRRRRGYYHFSSSSSDSDHCPRPKHRSAIPHKASLKHESAREPSPHDSVAQSAHSAVKEANAPDPAKTASKEAAITPSVRSEPSGGKAKSPRGSEGAAAQMPRRVDASNPHHGPVHLGSVSGSASRVAYGSFRSGASAISNRSNRSRHSGSQISSRTVRPTTQEMTHNAQPVARSQRQPSQAGSAIRSGGTEYTFGSDHPADCNCGECGTVASEHPSNASSNQYVPLGSDHPANCECGGCGSAQSSVRGSSTSTSSGRRRLAQNRRPWGSQVDGEND